MDDVANIPTRSLADKKIPFEILAYIPEDSAAYYKFIPMGLADGVLEIGMVEPENIEARDALQFIATRSGLPFKVFRISKGDFESVLKNYSGLGSRVNEALGQIEKDIEVEAKKIPTKDRPKEKKSPNIIEEAPVTKIVGVVLQHATSGNASDIHIEPLADKIKVRFRVDGALYTSLFLPINVHEAVVARIKILTNMKLDEKRKPQDGRFSAKVQERKIDFRVSTMPTYFGEKVVIRILDPKTELLNMDSLGIREEDLSQIKEVLGRPYGIVLVTGPTGSGKTTTLYSMLGQLDKEKYNVVSLEDPIEYNIQGVNQSQVRPEIEYTFANGLRSILRQDPDIILVGEIRDKETAKLAIQAALTGHLVLSTLHTNNAAGAIPRLVDMGVDPYLIAPTLALTIAQRLVPKICVDSKEEVPLDGGLRVMVEKQFEDMPVDFREKIQIPDKTYRGVKSPSCPSGVKGRLGVFEVIKTSPELEHVILTNPVEEEIYKLERGKGFISMKEDAMLKAFKGLLPFEEVSKL